MTPIGNLTAALKQFARGDIVVVTDDDTRENEGDLIMAAEAATPDRIAFFLRHTSGVLCAALTPGRCDELRLPQMVTDNAESQGTAFTVSVDAAQGTSTGISAADRALTLRSLADPNQSADAFLRPGHVFPLRAREGGVLKRAGHTEAAVDLAQMAGLRPAGILCEVVDETKQYMARGAQLEAFARRHRLPLISIADLVRHRLQSETLVSLVGEGRVPTAFGSFNCQSWRSHVDGQQHASLTLGDLTGPEPVLVRVHSECLTGDVFGSSRCDCGQQLNDAIAAIASAGRGAVVYLRGQEGRGIGLGHKLRAYRLQDTGLDTVDANLAQGLPVDSREYGIGAQILGGLGVQRLRLLTNNPAKYSGLAGFGLEIVERVPLPPIVTSENVEYLRAKRERLAHVIHQTDLVNRGRESA